MSDFLLELRSEEIPARMQAGARVELEKLFRGQMAAAGVAVGELTLWSTPRRLALIARGLPVATQAVREEVKGPKASAPEQALAGFLRKTGLTREQLEERDGVLFAVTEKPGRATADVLAEAIPAIVRGFSWPKSQRWGAASLSTESLRWVRPLQGIVALLDGVVVDCEVGGIVSGRETVGHRFHSTGSVSVADAASYADDLRAAHVLVNHEERQDIIRAKAKEAAAAAGLRLVEDEGLVVENAGLTEWPQPLLGRFDEAFLEVPPEVIQLTARVNQKYFVCEDAAGKLANAFVCTANIDATDGGEGIIAGNRKVLAARLSDARFFWQQDLKTPLAVQAEKLSRITFHEKLGTVADKVARVAKLACWLVDSGVVKAPEGLSDAEFYNQVKDAATLCKADLVTEMVGEFPELQGLMGGYYARAEGLPDAVADAIRDHYKPVGQGDDVPTAPVTVCVALADKLDTLAHFFLIGETPTGSKDPFALRRAAIGVISLILHNGLRFRLEEVLLQACGDDLGAFEEVFFKGIEKKLGAFFADRLKVQQKEAGVRHDLIDAVFALGGEDDLVRLLARVHALQAFVHTEDGRNLLAAYKRAVNILKKETDGQISKFASSQLLSPAATAETLNFSAEPAEKALINALAQAAPRVEAAVADEDFTAAMRALASLRAAVDQFFQEVIVNADNPEIRSARLGLLSQLRAATHKVADFSRIEG